MIKRISISTIMFLFILVLASMSVYSESLSEGLLALPEQEAVFADHEGMWKYTLHIYNTEDEKVSIDKLIMKAYTFKGEYVEMNVYEADKIQEWWGSNQVKPGESQKFSGGFPNRNSIYFIDFILLGTNQNNEEVKGITRIHFLKPERQGINLISSNGISLKPETKTVFANEDGMWKYSIDFTATLDEAVEITRIIEMACTQKGDYVSGKIHTADQIKDWWGTNKISPEQTKQLSGGLPNKNNIYFIDFIAYGKDINGDEVKGACRVYFVKTQEDKDLGLF